MLPKEEIFISRPTNDEEKVKHKIYVVKDESGFLYFFFPIFPQLGMKGFHFMCIYVYVSIQYNTITSPLGQI